LAFIASANAAHARMGTDPSKGLETLRRWRLVTYISEILILFSFLFVIFSFGEYLVMEIGDPHLCPRGSREVIKGGSYIRHAKCADLGHEFHTRVRLECGKNIARKLKCNENEGTRNESVPENVSEPLRTLCEELHRLPCQVSLKQKIAASKNKTASIYNWDEEGQKSYFLWNNWSWAGDETQSSSLPGWVLAFQRFVRVWRTGNYSGDVDGVEWHKQVPEAANLVCDYHSAKENKESLCKGVINGTSNSREDRHFCAQAMMTLQTVNKCVSGKFDDAMQCSKVCGVWLPTEPKHLNWPNAREEIDTWRDKCFMFFPAYIGLLHLPHSRIRA